MVAVGMVVESLDAVVEEVRVLARAVVRLGGATLGEATVEASAAVNKVVEMVPVGWAMVEAAQRVAQVPQVALLVAMGVQAARMVAVEVPDAVANLGVAKEAVL